MKINELLLGVDRRKEDDALAFESEHQVCDLFVVGLHFVGQGREDVGVEDRMDGIGRVKRVDVATDLGKGNDLAH